MKTFGGRVEKDVSTGASLKYVVAELPQMFPPERGGNIIQNHTKTITQKSYKHNNTKRIQFEASVTEFEASVLDPKDLL